MIKKYLNCTILLTICLMLTACSSYNAHKGADDFFDGAISNASENQKKADSGVGNVESSATADAVAGFLNAGFNWLWSLLQSKQD